MPQRITHCLLIIFIFHFGTAQVLDDFEDGDFTDGFEWTGNIADFEVDAYNQLHLNAPSASAESYLVIPNSLSKNTTWEFYVELDFNPSSSNQLFVYLMADAADLTGSLNGYFVRIGNTADEVSLYKQTGTSQTIIIDGEDKVLDVNSVSLRVKVTRDENGIWELFRDETGSENFTSEGTGMDDTFWESAYFGFLCDYTSTRSDKFYMDDVVISKPLEIDTAFAKSSTEIEIVFDQWVKSAGTNDVSNFTISDSEANSVDVITAYRSETDRSTVELTVDSLFTADFILTVNNVRDSIAETVSDPDYSFSYINLELQSILTLSETEVQLTFNDRLDPVSAENVNNYQIDHGIGQPGAAVIDPVDRSSVALTLDNPLFEGATFQLSLSGIENEPQNSTLTTSENFNFIIPLVIDTVYAVSQNEVLVSFNKALNESIAETASNFFGPGIGNPISAVLQEDGMSVMLAFDNELTSGTYTVAVSNLQDTDGNEIDAGGNSTDFSYLELSLDLLEQLSETSILLKFNQALEELSAETPDNYQLTETGNPTSVIYQENDSTVILEFARLYNTRYFLSVQNISNQFGNATTGNDFDSLEIDIEAPTDFREVILNELLPDPTPVIGLPDAEYVELYNPSGHSLNIEKFQLNGAELPGYILPTDGLVVLTSSTNADLFSIENVLGITGFDILTNSGEPVVLEDQYGNKLDSIYYDLSWYNDPVKDDDGGYSLELIDPLQPCSGKQNWSSSVDVSGGTPGAQNSIYSDEPDEMPPFIEGVEVIGGDTLYITFSEPVDVSSISTASFLLAGYNFEDLVQTGTSGFYLKLDDELGSEVTYELSVSSISDCFGNVLDLQSFGFYHDINPPVLERVILLSENEIGLIFHEPLGRSSAEDEDNFSIDGVAPVKSILQDSSNQRVHLLFEAAFDEGSSYLVDYSGIADTLGNVRSDGSVSFDYQDQIDTAYIVSANLMEIVFSQSPRQTTALATDRYFVTEGTGRPQDVIPDEQNPKRYRLAFASNFKENKDIKIYVEGVLDQHEEQLLTPAYLFYYDTRGPGIEELMVKNDSQLVVSYDEKVDLQIATATSFYELENGENPIRINTVSGSDMELTFAGRFEMETEKILTVMNIRDLAGNTMRTKKNIAFSYDVRPPEILSICQLSDTTLHIMFSEIPLLSTLQEFSHFSLDDQNPHAVQPLGPDSLGSVLYFSSIPASETSELVVGGIQDKKGNVSVDSVYIFNSLNPQISLLQAVNDTILQVHFSKPMSTSALEAENYVVSGFEIESIRSVSDFTYQIEIATRLSQGDSVVLSANNLTDQYGNSLFGKAFRTTFDAYLESVNVLNAKTVEIIFSTAFDAVDKAWFSLMDNNIALATLDGEDKSKILLSLESSLAENQVHLLKWSGLRDVYGRYLPAYFEQIIFDTEPPGVADLSSDFFGVLNLTFSERLDADISVALDKYQLPGLGHPKAIEVVLDSVFALDFQDVLETGETYSLALGGVADRAGNFSENDTIQFTYNPPWVPSYGQIIINEIMADPLPSAGLPEAEYIELYNISDQVFNLKGLRIGDVTKTVAVSDYVLIPNEYVLITANASLFEGINVLEVSGLPALGNSSDSVFIQTVYGELIDEVKYTTDWYGHAEKSDGGYSLELINPFGICPGSVNWKASESDAGGTPGEQNSVYSTEPDNTIPEILVSELIDDQAIKITFNEAMDSISLINASVELSGFETANSVSGADFTELTITLTEPLDTGLIYELSVSGATDCSGTGMESETLEIGIGKVPEPGDLIFTEIMADPEPVVGLPNAEYLEVYNNSGVLISLSNLLLIDATDTTFLPDINIPADSYFILSRESSRSIFEAYGTTIGLSKWLSLNNTGELLILANSASIDEVAYSKDWYRDTDKADGGYSLEIINPLGICPGSVNWTASESDAGGTPGEQNSVFNMEPDNTIPEVLTAELIDDQTIKITFSEAMDSLSLINSEISTDKIPIFNKEVSGVHNEILLLTFGEDVLPGTVYSMKISGAADCTGNEMETANLSFGIGKKPGFNELIITEIMADPDPSAGLPASEYIELYNASDQLLSLTGLILSDTGDSTMLPSAALDANQYLLLLPNASVPQFEIPNKIGISNWVSLANSGEELFVTDGESIICQVNYTRDWHESDEKAEGGYSLEMKDLMNPCAGYINWGSSASDTGGTPGFSNANSEDVPDNFGPNLIEVIALSSDSLKVLFDERLTTGSDETAIFSITPQIAIDRIYQNPLQTTEMYLNLSQELTINKPYQLEVENVRDCSGNKIRNNAASFVLPDQPDSLDVILNEILFDPRTDGVDFVEIYNNSAKYLDMKNWQIARDRHGELEKRKITGQTLMLEPQSYLAISEDTLILKSHYSGGYKPKFFQVPRLPVFPNAEGTAVLIAPDGTISDVFSYENDYHQSFLKSVDGVSLERISFDAPTQDPNNWQSASAVAGFATPGYMNSQSFEAPTISGSLEIDPKVFVPNSSNPAHQSFTTINYQLDKGGQFANILVYNQLGQPVAELAKGSSLSTSGFIRWDGTNSSGNIVRMGYYIVLFEIYDSEGNQEVMKETVVVGR